MIRRGPHGGAVAEADNNTVWRAIRQVFGDGPAKNWIKEFTRDQDGRSAYFAIHEHYLGTGFQNRIKTQADHTITTIFYKGNNKNFRWDRFTGKLNAAFNDLEEHGEGCSEEKKVRVLLDRIQCPALEVACATVRAQENLATNYTEAVNFIGNAAELYESRFNEVRCVSAP